MKRILVIGSKGFIGNHLTRHLINRGFDVYQADVVADYASEHYVRLEASNADFHEVFENTRFDGCVNCSGAANVGDSMLHPYMDFSLNTHNVFKMLDAIRRFNPECRFLNLSSAAVYGNPGILPVNETTKVSPVSPYGYHKMMSEKICEEFHKLFGIATCSARIFSAYGEGLQKQLFWDLSKKANTGTKVELFGTGHESRDFIHVSDVTLALEVLLTKGRFSGDAVNVAGGNEITIEDAVSLFYTLFNPKVKFVFTGETREGDPINWKADISVLRGLGFSTNVTLADGLKKYVDWLRKE
jgi:dTDP-glucose 4,6-dehydratase/UDP-glucose 4-epimerase